MPYDDPILGELDGYFVAEEPGRRERAEAWAMAIGLQKVDGLTPSRFLLDTAKEHIEGRITGGEATRIVDDYYESKAGRDAPKFEQEADRVSARINEVVAEDGFTFSPEYFIALHGLIFKGVFPHAGCVRDVNLRKREWVLKGDSVVYGPATMIERTLDYDFDREREYRYAGKPMPEIAGHFARFISGIWQIHPFREGNTRTTAVFAVKYLKSMRIEASNEPFAGHARYFRDALVRANYENPIKGVARDFRPLEAFFRNLLLGEENELKSRYLLIGLTEEDKQKIRELTEGTRWSEKSGQKKVVRKGLSEKGCQKTVVKSGPKTVVESSLKNSAAQKTGTSEIASKNGVDGKRAGKRSPKKSDLKTVVKSSLKTVVKSGQKKVVRKRWSEKGGQKTSDRLLDLMRTDPFLTQEGMVRATGINRSAVQKHISNLKSAGRLRRVGPDKGGRWEVAE